MFPPLSLCQVVIRLTERGSFLKIPVYLINFSLVLVFRDDARNFSKTCGKHDLDARLRGHDDLGRTCHFSHSGASGNPGAAGQFCSHQIFPAKTAGLPCLERLETPSPASYHQAVAL